jgi:hypothetical protein
LGSKGAERAGRHRRRKGESDGRLLVEAPASERANGTTAICTMSRRVSARCPDGLWRAEVGVVRRRQAGAKVLRGRVQTMSSSSRTRRHHVFPGLLVLVPRASMTRGPFLVLQLSPKIITRTNLTKVLFMPSPIQYYASTLNCVMKKQSRASLKTKFHHSHHDVTKTHSARVL